MLCFTALVVYCTKSRRAERYWQKTLLQMEEMESQIREEIRKGVFTKKPANTHTQKKQPFILTHSYTITVAYLYSDGLHRLKVLYILIICLFAIPVSFLFSTKVRGIQQLTHLSLVSATHKTQRLPNDHKWSRDTICGHACWVCAVGTGTCMYMCACNVKARPPPRTQIYDAETG